MLNRNGLNKFCFGFVLLLIAALLFACGEKATISGEDSSSSDDTIVDDGTDDEDEQEIASLGIEAPADQIAVGESITFTATGGEPPYNFSLNLDVGLTDFTERTQAFSF